ncbi:HNH endonuclease signature motif containing protein [Deinococcus budaensis]|uniref:HNH endonuclease n=1 Tax=Deinococcus budaensis TaxID=1665626 RepID=A0A7W8LRG9_9DEIO|nr:HNH endonuclease [Deinococcus budaensis]MBB5235612.1 hypothetical protein [Deinococcus budaensis]
MEREVRKRSGFGCIICGRIFCDYHHLEEFSTVTEHDPSKIVLLCKEHHGDVTNSNPANRRISNETLEKYIRSPYGITKGHNRWESVTDIKGLRLGNFFFENTKIILRIDGRNIISICGADDFFPSASLNAIFFDHEGREVLRVERNLIKGNTDSWDFQSTGNLITINNSSKDIALSVRFGSDGVAVVERLKMRYMDSIIEITPNGSMIAKFGCEASASITLVSEAKVTGADVAVEVKEGSMMIGRSERTLYAKGASRVGFRPAGTRRQTSDAGIEKEPINHSRQKEPNRLDFKGMSGGLKIDIEGLEYSRGMTPIKLDKKSVQIGVPTRSEHGNNSMYVKKLEISGE